MAKIVGIGGVSVSDPTVGNFSTTTHIVNEYGTLEPKSTTLTDAVIKLNDATGSLNDITTQILTRIIEDIYNEEYQELSNEFDECTKITAKKEAAAKSALGNLDTETAGYIAYIGKEVGKIVYGVTNTASIEAFKSALVTAAGQASNLSAITNLSQALYLGIDIFNVVSPIIDMVVGVVNSVVGCNWLKLAEYAIKIGCAMYDIIKNANSGSSIKYDLLEADDDYKTALKRKKELSIAMDENQGKVFKLYQLKIALSYNQLIFNELSSDLAELKSGRFTMYGKTRDLSEAANIKIKMKAETTAALEAKFDAVNTSMGNISTSIGSINTSIGTINTKLNLSDNTPIIKEPIIFEGSISDDSDGGSSSDSGQTAGQL